MLQTLTLHCCSATFPCRMPAFSLLLPPPLQMNSWWDKAFSRAGAEGRERTACAGEHPLLCLSSRGKGGGRERREGFQPGLAGGGGGHRGIAGAWGTPRALRSPAPPGLFQAGPRNRGKVGRRRESSPPLPVKHQAAETVFADGAVVFACDPASPRERSQSSALVCCIFCLPLCSIYFFFYH